MMSYNLLEWMEFFSYAATIIGIPLAIFIFYHQERKERSIELLEIYDKLMGHYTEIQNKLFDHPELDIHDNPLKNIEDARRQYILYEMVISLFERSFILLHGENDPEYHRMWNSWLDYIKQWLVHQNFRDQLPHLMKGEDKDFVAYIAQISGLDLKP
ncbi:MAG: hypothetical protein KDJ26_00415 [Alphaproteobacteria bacterium]|jgi:hypothetical protein|nr:hypothetical protein [Alphaproteobacteria bacterium]MCB1550440.1 hypothetical protein [Alphaproteobacteria bacterium]MCB9985531.1 hypothetical protein [Micavibrio sp.]